MAQAIKNLFMVDGILGGFSRYHKVHFQGNTTGPYMHAMWGVFAMSLFLEAANHYGKLPDPARGKFDEYNAAKAAAHAAAHPEKPAPAEPVSIETDIAMLKRQVADLQKELGVK
eukprot:CAMPEP_0196572102 /NCGR_PEP_ID=MMETSP1081-20130531/2213_1 /TAXON_ID=36882 /ORGANISM="Pyramimonas amylifera, Strain CCMP720" /LENGTH=113 /DNA_ID=CAMNT_0041889305 /DNA_START=59 /DNA_END=400 /DNA_ORIENTATION=+